MEESVRLNVTTRVFAADLSLSAKAKQEAEELVTRIVKEIQFAAKTSIERHFTVIEELDKAEKACAAGIIAVTNDIKPFLDKLKESGAI